MAGQGFTAARLGDRFVTVKGVAEREVEADLAVWTIQFSAGGNQLAEVQRTIDRNLELTLGSWKAIRSRRTWSRSRACEWWTPRRTPISRARSTAVSR
jgi:hypothetical protein